MWLVPATSDNTGYEPFPSLQTVFLDSSDLRQADVGLRVCRKQVGHLEVVAWPHLSAFLPVGREVPYAALHRFRPLGPQLQVQ